MWMILNNLHRGSLNLGLNRIFSWSLITLYEMLFNLFLNKNPSTKHSLLYLGPFTLTSCIAGVVIDWQVSRRCKVMQYTGTRCGIVRTFNLDSQNPFHGGKKMFQNLFSPQRLHDIHKILHPESCWLATTGPHQLATWPWFAPWIKGCDTWWLNHQPNAASRKNHHTKKTNKLRS